MRSILQILFMTMLLPVVANANLLYNGDFEVVDNRIGQTNGFALQDIKNSNPRWDVFNSLPGWTTLYGSGIEVQNYDLYSGDYYVELDAEPDFRFTPSDNGSNSGMSQSVSGLNIGQAYQLSFWYKSRSSNIDDNGINVYWYDGAASYTTGLVHSFVDVFVNDWTQYTFNLIATHSTMNVGFGAFGSYWNSSVEMGLRDYMDTHGMSGQPLSDYSETTGDGLGGLLDDIVLDATAIPEPASVLMVLCGLALMGFARRKSIV